jgi:hypothetical protein
MPRPKEISGGISHAIFTHVVRIMDEHDLEEVRIGELHIKRRMKDPNKMPIVLPPQEPKTIQEAVEKATEEEPEVPFDDAVEQSAAYQLWRLGALSPK